MSAVDSAQIIPTFDLISPAGAVEQTVVGNFQGKALLQNLALATAGTYSIICREKDGTRAGNYSINLTLIGTGLNQTPVPVPIGPQTVAELVQLRVTASATDPDVGQTLTYSLEPGFPAGMAINATTGEITWTPTEAQGPGAFPITVRVTDNGTPPLSATTTFTVTVTEVNQAPVLSAGGNETISEGQPWGRVVSATDADLPANTVIFTLEPPVPPGMTVNPATGEITWTPAEAQEAGAYPVTVKVTDNGTPALGDSETFTLTVTEVNRAPVLSAGGDETIDELAPWSRVVSATDSDVPANTLTFSLVSAPPGMAINAATLTLSWTPTEPQGPGTHPVTVRVTDGAAPVEQTFNLTVREANQAPVLGVLEDRTVVAGSLVTFAVLATDADLPPQALEYSLAPGAPVGAAINPVNGVFTWTPTGAQATNGYPITVRASDGAAMVDRTFTVTVRSSNCLLLPAGAIAVWKADGDFKDSVGGHHGIPFEAGFEPGFIGQAFRFDGMDDLIEIPHSADLSFGNRPWTVEAWVLKQDDREVFHLLGKRVRCGDFDYQLGYDNRFADLPVDRWVHVAWVHDGSTVSLFHDGILVGTDTQIRDGENEAPLHLGTAGTCEYFRGLIDELAIYNRALSEAEVRSIVDAGRAGKCVNHSPQLTAGGDESIPEEQSWRRILVAADADTAQTLTFTLESPVPPGMTIDPATGELTWTPTEAQGAGAYPVRVKVADNGTPALSDSKTFTLTVTELNLPPVLSAGGNEIIDELAPWSRVVAATDPDVPANTLTFELVSSPTGLTFNTASRTLSWTPSEAQGPGTYSVTVRVADGIAPVEQSFTLTVREVNQLPRVIDLSVSADPAHLGTPLVVTVVGTDADLPAQALTYLLEGHGENASGRFEIVPTTAGSLRLLARVRDPAGALSEAVEKVVTVTDANRPPVISNIADQQTGDGELTWIPFTVGDQESPANRLTVTATSSNTELVPNDFVFLSGNGADRFVLSQPLPGVTGTVTITVRVTDEGGLFAQDQFTVRICPCLEPELEVDLYPVLTIHGTPGQVYLLKYSEDLGEPKTWQPLATITLQANPQLFIDMSGPARAKRFYQAIHPPTGTTNSTAIPAWLVPLNR